MSDETATREELLAEVHILREYKKLVENGITDMAKMKAILHTNLTYVKTLTPQGRSNDYTSGFIAGVDACLTHLENMPWQKEFKAAKENS